MVEDDLTQLPDSSMDAIFCFGSRHFRVPQTASTLLQLNVAPLALITGGPSRSGERPESDLFADAIVASGVKRSRLVVEREALHTGENVTLGMAALLEHCEATSIVGVAWPLAARRVVATFALHHPEIRVYSAPALRMTGWRWCPTPKRVGLMLGEFDRLTTYRNLGWVRSDAPSATVQEAAEVLRGEHLRLTHLPELVGRAGRFDASGFDDAFFDVEAPWTAVEAK